MAGAWAALLAFGARAEAPAPAPPDLDAEIAWARATWPSSFEGVHFHAPIGSIARGHAEREFTIARWEIPRPEATSPDR